MCHFSPRAEKKGKTGSCAHINTYIHYITLHYITSHHITLHYITYIQTCMHACIHICTYIHIHVYIFICAYQQTRIVDHGDASLDFPVQFWANQDKFQIITSVFSGSWAIYSHLGQSIYFTDMNYSTLR